MLATQDAQIMSRRKEGLGPEGPQSPESRWQAQILGWKKNDLDGESQERQTLSGLGHIVMIPCIKVPS